MGGGRAVFSQGVSWLMREREGDGDREGDRETFKHIFNHQKKIISHFWLLLVFFCMVYGIKQSKQGFFCLTKHVFIQI